LRPNVTSWRVRFQYCDLDEFLSENGLPVEGDHQNGTTAGTVNPGTIVAVGHQGGALMPGANNRLSSPPPPPASIHPIQHLQTNGVAGVGVILTKREPSPSPSEPLSPITINPASPADSSEFRLQRNSYFIIIIIIIIYMIIKRVGNGTRKKILIIPLKKSMYSNLWYASVTKRYDVGNARVYHTSSPSSIIILWLYNY